MSSGSGLSQGERLARDRVDEFEPAGVQRRPVDEARERLGGSHAPPASRRRARGVVRRKSDRRGSGDPVGEVHPDLVRSPGLQADLDVRSDLPRRIAWT